MKTTYDKKLTAWIQAVGTLPAEAKAQTAFINDCPIQQ